MRRIARPLLAAAFVGQGVESLRRPQQAGQTARPAFDGLKQLPDEVATKVPSDVETFARVNALVQIGGGLLLASGRMPRIAAAALACTVIPGSAGGHLFWAEPDPQRRAQQRQALLTDVSLIGGLMIAASDTEGKPSLGWRARRAARHAYERAATALPTTSGDAVLETVGERVSAGLQSGAEHGRELAELVGEKAGPLLEAAGERGSQLAEVAADRGTEWVHAARENATTLAESARRRLHR
ncbi:DoxX family protein [Mycobacterium sp. CSUR Q5927]|nr:DoxX family protein [Mycobacterium sp. CSUR Q5927]